MQIDIQSGDTRLIVLSQGKRALVDAEDYQWLGQYKWSAWHNGGTWYALMGIGSKSNNQPLLMHRLIMQTPITLDVDHINHNGLDNRRVNLRNCTRSQNNMNQRIRSVGTSKFKGVSWDKERNLWRAQLVCNGKRILYARFSNEKKASLA